MPPSAPVDEPEALRRIADRDVVGDGQVGDERELLEDADDAGAIGSGGQSRSDLRPVEDDASGVRPDDAPQDFDEGRLAGAVLAKDRMDPPGGDGKVGVLQRANPAVAL